MLVMFRMLFLFIRIVIVVIIRIYFSHNYNGSKLVCTIAEALSILLTGCPMLGT